LKLAAAHACFAFITISGGSTASPSPQVSAGTDAVESAAARRKSAERDVDGPFELRAGPEVLPHQAITGLRDYSLSESGTAFGGFAAGLANATGRLWLGAGLSFAALHGEKGGYSPYGSIGGWLLHWPVLVELVLPAGGPESRAIAGFELGAMWGKLTNVYTGILSDPTVSLGGYFFGLRGGYVIPIADDFGFGAVLGVRAGRLDQTDSESADANENEGLIYLALACQLVLRFQP
jgi:hypothetical protein